ncbi:MAG: replication restart helicase PriA [Desulfobacterales bacterium]
MNPRHRMVDIAVALPVHGLYTYRVPGHLAESAAPARRVLVAFGKRRVTGYVIGESEKPADREIKDILDVLDDGPLFPAAMIPFYRWVADYYHHPIGDVIRAALPGGLNLYEFKTLTLTEAGCRLPDPQSLSRLEREILDCLSRGSCTVAQLTRHLDRPVPGALIQAMERCGWVRRRRELKGGQTRPRTETFVALLCSEIPGKRITPARRILLERLEKQRETPLSQLRPLVASARATVRLMERDGFVRLYEKPVYRDPFGEAVLPDEAPALNPEQQRAVRTIVDSLPNGFGVFLLEGVTGSGKTEVYLQAAASVLDRGRRVLVLVPEIALISQTERRFRARFGDLVALLHSGLSEGERYDQWMRVHNGEARVVVGARSAIFAPLDDIGLIVVDEEHDPSYKQDTGLRYNARDLAVVRGKFSGSPVVVGSATPSVQSAYHAGQGRYHRLPLTRRIGDRPLPTVEVVDLRGLRDRRGMAKFLTPAMMAAIGETLERREQVLLFLNRRGFASHPVCSECGAPLRCRNCDITLTLHQKANAYRCHYCGHSRPSISPCDACGSTSIWQMGLGTEKVELTLSKRFPGARIARMDRDTTGRKGRLVGILKALKNREIDILVGTQMVAKGHDFAHITLVGIVCADLSLSFPDFRAGERTFQLLAQVAGRAGRGERPGRVILQTYNPDHFSIQAARAQDTQAFYEQEIRIRMQLAYPPFSRMAQIRIAARDAGKASAAAGALGEKGRQLLADSREYRSTIRLLGPAEAPLARIAGRHRWQILIFGARSGPLHRFLAELTAGDPPYAAKGGVQLAIDVDPVFMM